MRQGKNNIISEITRIHQIMGINKQISEQVLASTPAVLFRKLAGELAQYASQKSLDKTSRSLVSKLSRGTKQITDASGKKINTSLDDGDYLNIFGKLRTSPDQGIRRIIQAADNIITDLIVKEDFPDLLRDPDIIKKFQGWIQNGVSEDLVVDAIAKVIRDKYGVYADDVIDELLNSVRKVYKDLGGKVDDVVDDVIDDTGKVVDDTGKVVDDVADDSASGADDAAATAEEKIEEIEPKLPELEKEDNISKDLLELSPVFTRYTNDTLTKLETLSNELQGLIESRTAPGGNSTQVDEIDKQIKNAFEGIWNINREYVEKLESQIDYNLQFNDGPNYSKWLKIRDYVQYIKGKYGTWGAWKISTPKSQLGIFVNSTLEAAFRTELKIIKEGLVKTIREWWARTDPKVDELEKQAQTFSREIDTDLKTKVIWWEKLLFPGSPRGLPKRLELDDKGLYYPNAYGEILKYSTKYPKVKAYLSLFLEKLIIVGKVQVLYSVVMTAKDFWKFFWTENEVQRKYRTCIKATSLAMKEGKMKKGEEFDVNSVPPCLMKLMKSTEFKETELEDFLVRADFFSRGNNTEILSKTFNKYLLEMGMLDPMRMFTGVYGQVLIKFFNEWLPKIIEIENEGDAYAFEEDLINALETFQTDTTALNTGADSLLLNMTSTEQDEVIRALDSIQAASGESNLTIVDIND
jgi:hypothetical protein